MLSLIFYVSELCVKGFSLGGGERDPPLQPHPLGLSVELAVSTFILGHGAHCGSGGISALL